MMKTNYAIRGYLKRCFYIVIVLGMAVSAKLSAQTSCSLACKSAINISVADATGGCTIMLTADMILNGDATSCPGAGAFVGTITAADGTTILAETLPHAWATAYDYIHEKVSFSITDPLSKNTCWGHATIEDKLAPVITCDLVMDVVSCCSDNIFVDPGTSPGMMTGSGAGICAITGSGASCVQECSDFEWVVISQISVQNTCDGTICPDFSRVIERKLVAVDEWGYVSADTLTQQIKVKRVDISVPGTVLCPVDYKGADALTCETLPEETILLEDVVVPAPTLKGGGLPSLIKNEGAVTDTIPLYPLNAGDSLSIAVFQNCNIGVRYEDRLIPKVGKCGGYTLVRNWIINEWACPEEVADTCTQVFELIDNDGPTLVTGVNDFEGSTNGYTCEGNVFVPAPVFVDKCSGIERIDVTYPGGFTEGFSPNGGFLNLPVGSNTVVFIAYDECHNVSLPDTVIVDVWDKTPPVAICDEHTVVSLADYGKNADGVNTFNAEVPAEVFDDGSYDDCGLKNVLVRKMNPDLCGLGQDTLFRPTAKFCCAEDFVMVIIRVFDHNDNYNDCMFEVEIQNKIEPKIIQCPVDIMVSCGLNFDTGEPGMSSVFGTIVSETELVDTYHFIGDDRDAAGFLATGIGNQPDTLCDGTDAAAYEIWDGVYWDNCGGSSVDITNEDKRNKCGIGDIIRTFSLRNAGGKLIETCQQVVQVKPVKPFDFNTIEMPENVDVMACGDPDNYGPDVTGYPLIQEGQCDLVGFNYKDQVFLFNEYEAGSTPACFKILRTWQFIDWCTFDGSTNQPFPMPAYEQVIKVRDKDAPEILFSCEERSECSYDPDCSTGYIELLKTAVDGCTGSDHLRWEAEVYIDIKGTVNVIDTVFSGVGNLANASAHYPIGKHLVNWTFWDRCGNVTHCDQIFHIKNCKAAAPYCIDGLVVDLMPMDEDGDGIADSGMVELWASDFDLGSTHPCGYPVILSFSEDIDDRNRTFTCNYRERIDVNIYSSVIVGEGEHADVVQSFCKTHLRIQDNNNVCDGRGTISQAALISGLITTELNQTLAEAAVNLEGSELAPSMTNDVGEYAFPNMPIGGAYLVTPQKNDDHINGVSTLDLVMIQKHILGLKLLEGPYKKIAADINRDQSISASDLVELRRLILGNVSEFEANDSWRFLDKTYAFANEDSPLNELFSEDYDIPELSEDMDIDFTAIKIGDVNNSVAIANYQTTEVRSSNTLALEANAEYKGNELRIPVYSSTSELISGLQFTLDFSNEGLEYVSIESGLLDINSENLGLLNSDRGLVAMSWNTSELVRVDNSEVMFTIVLRGNGADHANPIVLNSKITTAEAYNETNEVMDVSLEITSDELVNGDYDLKQNTPNPFKDETVITFSLPSTMNAKVSIHDITGKVLREYNSSYSAGLNSVSISRSDLEISGVLYYTLKTDNYSATKRMVIID